MQPTDEEKISHTNATCAKVFILCDAYAVNEAEEIWTFSICLGSDSASAAASIIYSFISYAVH